MKSLALSLSVFLLGSSLLAQAGDVYQTRSTLTLPTLSAGQGISIRSPGDEFDVLRSEVPVPALIVDYAASSESKLDSIVGKTHFTADVMGLSIFVGRGSGAYFYKCSMLRLNGRVTKANGACVVSIQLVIPENFDGKITFNAKVIEGPISVANLVEMLGDGFESDRDEAIDDYLENADSPTITAQEMISILEAISFDSEKLKVLERLISRVVANFSEFSAIVDVFTFSSDKEKARKIISRS